MGEFHSRWLDWSPKSATGEPGLEAASVSFDSAVRPVAKPAQLAAKAESASVSFGGGLSEGFQKTQLADSGRGQAANSGPALPKPTKAPSTPAPATPFDQFMIEWQTTAQQVLTLFKENRIKPSRETHQAATWLQFGLNNPWSCCPRISRIAARRTLKALVQGQCTAHIDDDARVVVHNASGPAFASSVDGVAHQQDHQPQSAEPGVDAPAVARSSE